MEHRPAIPRAGPSVGSAGPGRLYGQGPGELEQHFTPQDCLDATMTITYVIAFAAATDAGNRSMRAASRTSWNADDYQAACDCFERLYGELAYWSRVGS